jgi:hypothetical protein
MAHDTVTKIIPTGRRSDIRNKTIVYGNRERPAFIPPTRLRSRPSDAAMLVPEF